MRPAVKEDLDVLKIELKELGEFLSIIVFGVENVGEKKLHNSRGR